MLDVRMKLAAGRAAEAVLGWVSGLQVRVHRAVVRLEEEHPQSEELGDRVVARARREGWAAPEGASLDGPPFKHDEAKAPLMIDVEHLKCEHPDCEQEVNLFVEAITPFGSPLICSLHAAELYLYGITRHEIEPEERGDVWAWVRDVCRHGPTKRRERLEWLAIERATAAAGKAEAEGAGGA